MYYRWSLIRCVLKSVAIKQSALDLRFDQSQLRRQQVLDYILDPWGHTLCNVKGTPANTALNKSFLFDSIIMWLYVPCRDVSDMLNTCSSLSFHYQDDSIFTNTAKSQRHDAITAAETLTKSFHLVLTFLVSIATFLWFTDRLSPNKVPKMEISRNQIETPKSRH